jgi:DUF4097 and DUF4098 domain-containing protein YvlB
VKYVWITALFVMAALAPASAKEYRMTFERQADTVGISTLDLTWIAGDCELTASDTDLIQIMAIKRVEAVSAEDANDLADHIQIQIEKIKDHLAVGTRYLRTLEKLPSFWQKMFSHGGDASFGMVDWKVKVPAGLKVRLTSSRGSITVGQIRNDLTIRSSASDISLASIEGAVTIDNGSGRLTGELIIGPVAIRQMLGTVNLQFVEGDIRIKSSSANISIEQELGALDLTTTTGNVDIRTNLESTRDYLVTTESGDIRLSVPESSSAQLKLNSRTGEIKTEMPVAIKSMSSTRLEGVFGEGGVRISLSSMSGDVTVAQF